MTGLVLSSRTKPSEAERFPSTLELTDLPPVQHDLSTENLEGACQEFRRILGDDGVSKDEANLLNHSGSEFLSYAWNKENAIASHVIIYPSSTEEVAQVIKVCHRRRIPITPYSGGTSIEGQYIPDLGGVCIDFSRMNKIMRVNPVDLDCIVQPGLSWMDLNEELAAENLFFPPDPGPGALIGGMIGTGCSGTNAAAYGTMKDWVISLTVVLADGTVVKTRQRPRKSSAGYDLTRLIIGSEGTLGLVTEVTLKLTVKHTNEAVAVCTFPSIKAAARTVEAVVSKGIPVAAVEILDDVQMHCINQAGMTRRKWKEEPSLFFKFTGHTDAVIQSSINLVKDISQSQGSTSYVFAADQEERDELWSARKAALWSVMALRQKPTDKVWTTDVAVPLSRMADLIDDTKAEIKKSGLLGSIVGHVGDGNFHALLVFPEENRELAEKLVHDMVDKAISMEGTVTGEHGVGLVKRDFLEKELGKTTVDMMRQVSITTWSND